GREVEEVEPIVPAVDRLLPLAAALRVLEAGIIGFTLADESLEGVALAHEGFLLCRMRHHHDIISCLAGSDTDSSPGLLDKHLRKSLPACIQHTAASLRPCGPRHALEIAGVVIDRVSQPMSRLIE